MTKINLKSLKSEELLSREDLKQIIGEVNGSESPEILGYAPVLMAQGTPCMEKQF